MTEDDERPHAERVRRRGVGILGRGICMQCMMGAMTAGAAATGTRSWLATRRWAWLTPVRLRRITLTLMVGGLVAAATVLSGSG
jgi:hypothetical protein